MRDLMGIMKQAQAMQQKVQAVQEELDRLEGEGSSGGGMGKVVLPAKGQAKSLRIDPSLLIPEEAEIVEDLVVAALNDARQKADRAAQEKMEEVTKGLPLPPGLKLF